MRHLLTLRKEKDKDNCGRGFVLTYSNLFVIDLDNVYFGLTGFPEGNDIRDLIANLGCCYMEISASRKGLHIWGLVDFPENMPNKSSIMLKHITLYGIYT